VWRKAGDLIEKKLPGDLESASPGGKGQHLSLEPLVGE